MAGRSRSTGGAREAGVPEWVFRLFPILLFFVSFAPRLVAVNRYVTPDEPTWVYRSIQFREAVLDGRWEGTLVAGHPGVTTTWLGALGISAQMAMAPDLRASYDWLTNMAFLTPDNVEAFKRLAILLSGGRVAVALVNSLGVVGIYYMARRLWGPKVAIVAGLFLAFDPFLVGLSGLLHVDGLSAMFATMSLLGTAIGIDDRVPQESAGPRWAWFAMAGTMGGLAVLSKTPLLLLVPISGLALLWPLVLNRQTPIRDRILVFGKAVAAWGVAFSLTLIALYPALWVSPAGVMATVGGSANRHLDEALRETFFMGNAAYDHGPLFYPVVLLWRLSPVVWLGFLAAVLVIMQRGDWRKSRSMNRTILLLIAWSFLFVVAITPAAKKFDRYILPVVPSMLLLAAIAWARFSVPRWGLSRWIVPAMVLLQVFFLAFFAAYPLLAYNPLVGGPQTAVKVLPIGWGESISFAGSYLSVSEANATEERAISGVAPSLAPFFNGQTLVPGWDDAATADYVIVTVGGRQLDPAGVDSQTAGLTLLHTLHFGGLDQSWIYGQDSPLPPEYPDGLADPIMFGDQVALTAYTQTVHDDSVELSVTWQRLRTLADDERFVLRIVINDDQGNVWSTHETPLLNEIYFFPPDWFNDDTGVVRYQLELPPGIPPGQYIILFSLVDARTAGQLPVRLESGAFQGVAYEAGGVAIMPSETIVSAARMQIPIGDGTPWLDGQLQLLGFSEIADGALAGSRLPVELFWHVPRGGLPEGLRIAWHLVAEDGTDQVIATESLSRYDTGDWRTGETIHEKYQVPLPPNLAPGRYRLAVEPLDRSENSYGHAVKMGDLTINNIDRLYEVPGDIALPLDVKWEPMALLGVEPADLSAEPGAVEELTLFWEKLAPHGEVYTVFVHVIDNEGNIQFQADHWPGGLPTDILDGGQIVTDRFSLALPEDLEPGDYTILVGIYSTERGIRQPVIGGRDTVGLNGVDSFALPIRLRVTTP